MPSSNPLISVVMPAYNHESFVGEAIQSVLSQTFSDFELIIIDDGSSDSTAKIIHSFQDPRINYIHQENAGAHAAINRGLSQARGQYLSILNSDDVYAPKRLEHLVLHENSSGHCFSFTGVEYIDAKSGSINLCDPRRAWYDKLIKSYSETGDLLGTLFRGNLAVSTSNFFMARSVYERVGAFAEYRYAHDYDYLLRVFNVCGSELVEMVPEGLVGYRLHGNNTVMEDQPKLILETFRILANHLPDFICCDVDRKIIETALLPLLINAVEESVAIMDSRSWKMTAPLRWLAEAVHLPAKTRI